MNIPTFQIVLILVLLGFFAIAFLAFRGKSWLSQNQYELNVGENILHKFKGRYVIKRNILKFILSLLQGRIRAGKIIYFALTDQQRLILSHYHKELSTIHIERNQLKNLKVISKSFLNYKIQIELNNKTLPQMSVSSDNLNYLKSWSA